MLRSKRLEVVLNLEERREQAALDELTAARQRVDQLRQHLDQLRRYQADYREQMRQGQQGVVPVSRLQGWQAFIAQLNQVVAQQELQLQSALKAFEECRAKWQQAYERRRGMERYIASCREREQRAEDAREQKAMDEAAARAVTRRR
ncbi:MAG: flagellar export protein FliJ [Marinobacter sp.]|uniref:flagellar export protein FliJ n=1 Tax=Marinobacter sp. TaxID=50741 RepID=UPI00299D1281|nr:flagellar export protein FliJ [Marinobacter sp.]MDX1757579.1 flagellar export protein FliJ [Marinobacter sp.]